MFSPEKMRLNIIKANGLKVLNDTYNSSPQSVRAALSVLEEIEGSRKIAVLGDMLELGEWAKSSHTEIGRFAADMLLDYIITVGPAAANIVKGAIESGFSSERAASFENNTDALNYLLAILQKGDAVLIKGSRGMKMEEIVNSLTAEG
jgi:UDP-N-acetylmuramoyl-tripeptide--D-alanyl-D-alanine ligase